MFIKVQGLLVSAAENLNAQGGVNPGQPCAPKHRIVALCALSAALALVLSSLQGCGAISYATAAYKDQQRVKASHRDCVDRGDYGVCDRELVMVKPPPTQMDRSRLAPTLAPTKVTGPVPAPVPSARLAMSQAGNTVELSRTLLPMAYLANVVYHRHETKASTAVRSEAKACLRGQPLSTHPLEDPKAGSNGGWARMPGAAFCAAEEGLFYDTFIREPGAGFGPAHPVQVAIVFRGTENTLDQAGHDWPDNLMIAFGVPPRQYTIAIERLRATMQALVQLKALHMASNQRVEIYAVGHSLGGGLAQQAAYLHKEIDAVFAFNTSAVTNWTQLLLWDDGVHIQNHDPIVYRVQQQGEFLAYLRFVTTRASSSMVGRTDIEFNFGPPAAFAGHSMAPLVCHLAVRAAQAPDAAAAPLGYTPDEAQALSERLGVAGLGCDDNTLDKICASSSSYFPRLAARCASRPLKLARSGG